MKRAWLLLIPVVALVVASCVPAKPPPPPPPDGVATCESGVKIDTDLRPDLNITRHECTTADLICPGAFGCAIFAGVDDPANLIQMHADPFDRTTAFQYAEGFAHEEGHQWDWNRIDGPTRMRFVEIVGAYTVEGFAEGFRETVYHVAGNLTLSTQQRADLCADVMPCSPLAAAATSLDASPPAPPAPGTKAP